ncbi:MAG: hypothetical protein ACOYOK_10430 [Pseudobdellovibrionaceae bacterium]
MQKTMSILIVYMSPGVAPPAQKKDSHRRRKKIPTGAEKRFPPAQKNTRSGGTQAEYF